MRPGLKTDFFSLPKPRAFAHRGSGCSHPENTLASFAAAHEVGVRYMELDIHQTRDEQLAVSHDPDLERASGKPGKICEMTYGEVAKADAGYTFESPEGSHPFRGKGLHVPTLAEVLTSFPETRFIVEVKQIAPSVIPRLLQVLDETGMRRRVLAASEHQQPLDEIRAAAPDIPTNFSALEVGMFLQAMVAGFKGYTAPGEALQVPPSYESFSLVTPEIIAAAHQQELEVHVWTVNEEAQMRELIAAGVDGLISDYPARLLRVLGA